MGDSTWRGAWDSPFPNRLRTAAFRSNSIERLARAIEQGEDEEVDDYSDLQEAEAGYDEYTFDECPFKMCYRRKSCKAINVFWRCKSFQTCWMARWHDEIPWRNIDV